MLGLLHAAAVLFATELCVTLVDKDATSSEYQRVVDQFRLFCFWEGEGLHMLSCTHVIASHTHRVVDHAVCALDHMKSDYACFLVLPVIDGTSPSLKQDTAAEREKSLSLSHTHTQTHTTRASAPHTPLTQFFIYGICHID